MRGKDEVRGSLSSYVDLSSGSGSIMRLRSELMIAVRGVVDTWKVTQAEAARRLDLTQPRLNDLLRGRITRFSLDALVEIAGRAGLAVRLGVREVA